MVTRYQIGYRFELKCRDYWRRKGWSCDRTPASKTPYDLTAVIKTRDNRPMVLRIQCQIHKKEYFLPEKVRALIDWCEKEASQPILQWKTVGGKVKIRHAVDYYVEAK